MALLHSGHYEGHGEGHLLPLAQALLQTVDFFYIAHRDAARLNTRLQATHFAAFQRMIRRGFIQLTSATYPRGRWLDKTPTAEMIRAAPLMLELWPNAHFIFCKRRVLEVIASRRRKFPSDTLENHYLDWVDTMQSWLSIRSILGSHALEVEQIEMARDPNSVAASVAVFLNLTNPAAFQKALATDQPERTAVSTDWLVTLDSLGLCDKDIQELHAACDGMMAAYGYSYEK